MGAPSACRRRRWGTFTLRTLLAAVLLVAAGLGAWRAWVHSYERQREAAERFQKLGAQVFLRQVDPTSWRSLFGMNALDVTSISLQREVRSHFTVSFQGNFRGGDFMGVYARPPNVRVTAADLALLGDLPQLRRLQLPASAMDDNGSASLRGLTHLEVLDISGSKVTDKGLPHLSALTKLQRLDLAGLAITDRALPSLARMDRLESLDLSDTKITDAGLEHVARLRSLKYLFLNGTKITDAGLAHLRGLQNLTVLEMDRTRVTRRGVETLGVPSLRLVGVDRSAEFSPYEMLTLRKKMPGVCVFPTEGRCSKADVFVDEPSRDPLKLYAP